MTNIRPKKSSGPSLIVTSGNIVFKLYGPVDDQRLERERIECAHRSDQLSWIRQKPERSRITRGMRIAESMFGDSVDGVDWRD